MTRAVAMTTTKMWVMAMVARLGGDKEGKGKGGKGISSRLGKKSIASSDMSCRWQR